MTGQQLVPGPSVPLQKATVLGNQSEVVPVQLLDRMVVVPSAIVNVSLQCLNVGAEPEKTGRRALCTEASVLTLFLICRGLLSDTLSPAPVDRLPWVSKDKLTSCL